MRGMKPACRRLVVPLVPFVLAACAAPAWAQAQTPVPPLPPAVAGSGVLQPEPTRGRLLYETHCIACHDTQIHWRDAATVRDWTSLVREVRRWQERARLQWSDADVLLVARHLNATIYRFPTPGPA